MSLHPLIGDLSKLSTDELHKKFTELNNKMNTVYRLGMSDIAQQLRMVILDYQDEINRRNAKMMEDMASKSAEFKNIIDIK